MNRGKAIATLSLLDKTMCSSPKMTVVALAVANLLMVPTSASGTTISVGFNGCTLVDAVNTAQGGGSGSCGVGDFSGPDEIILPTNSAQLLDDDFDGNPLTGLPFITSEITI